MSEGFTVVVRQRSDYIRARRVSMHAYRPMQPPFFLSDLAMTVNGASSSDDSSRELSFDEAMLEEQTAGDASLAEELIRICLDECPSLLAQIRQAVVARDPEAIRFSAHTLKGALMNFGARRAVTAAQQLEQLGREQAFDAVDQVHQELEAAWSELERDLNAQLR